jgi:hypothetical protein
MRRNDHGHLRLVDADWLGQEPRLADTPSAAPSTDPNDLQELIARALQTIQSASPHASVRTIQLRNFRCHRYRLTEPLAVTLEEEGDVWVAVNYDTAQYGQGPSPEDAIEDLCRRLEEYFDLLHAERQRLGRQPKQHLAYLTSILEPIEP